MATPQPKLNPQQKAMQTAALLQAVSQLDMMLRAMEDAPDRVKKAGQEFKDALKEWADNG